MKPWDESTVYTEEISLIKGSSYVLISCSFFFVTEFGSKWQTFVDQISMQQNGLCGSFTLQCNVSVLYYHHPHGMPLHCDTLYVTMNNSRDNLNSNLPLRAEWHLLSETTGLMITTGHQQPYTMTICVTVHMLRYWIELAVQMQTYKNMERDYSYIISKIHNMYMTQLNNWVQ